MCKSSEAREELVESKVYELQTLNYELFKEKIMEHQFAAGGVVVKKEEAALKVLLIKDSYGHWTWPKGHIEEGETSKEAAIREISEETGLVNLNLLEPVGEQEYEFTFNGNKIFKTVYIFLVEATGEEKLKAQTEEIQGAQWFNTEKALSMIEYEGSREILEKGIESFKGVNE